MNALNALSESMRLCSGAELCRSLKNRSTDRTLIERLERLDMSCTTHMHDHTCRNLASAPLFSSQLPSGCAQSPHIHESSCHRTLGFQECFFRTTPRSSLMFLENPRDSTRASYFILPECVSYLCSFRAPDHIL